MSEYLGVYAVWNYDRGGFNELVVTWKYSDYEVKETVRYFVDERLAGDYARLLSAAMPDLNPYSPKNISENN